jgi:hypothetical protein
MFNYDIYIFKTGFAESKDDEQNNKVFVEFNTLAVIYGISSNRFIADEYQLKLENLPVLFQ